MLRSSSSRAAQPAAAASSTAEGTSGLPFAAVTAIAAPAGRDGAGAAGGSSMLDVPGHAEATIRLHKARIRALEEEQNKLIKALAGESLVMGAASLAGVRGGRAGLCVR